MIQSKALPDDKILDFKARLFKVVSDPNRLKILEILRKGDRCQCEIIPLIEQSQPSVSRHLRLLEESGLIRSTKDGTKIFYTVVDPHIFNMIDAIDENMIELVTREITKKYRI